MNWTSHILVSVVRVYQRFLSPCLRALTGPAAGCRFTPTCSEYAAQAFSTHGAARGSVLAIGRICRCHPWGGQGHDPVPEVAKRGTYCASNTRTNGGPGILPSCSCPHPGGVNAALLHSHGAGAS